MELINILAARNLENMRLSDRFANFFEKNQKNACNLSESSVIYQLLTR